MQDDNTGSLIEKFTGGGLPQLLLGPAGAAISRLVGAGVEIPAVWLEGFSQRIKDRNSGRSALTKVLAEKAAQLAVEDPRVMDRALNSFLAREYRAQNNREKVAEIALQSLADDPPPPESDGPTDQFMTHFERFAESATSEDIRTIFGRLLAGEIRQPNTVAQSTLQFVSMLDHETAQSIQRVLPYCLEGIAILDNIAPRLSVAQVTYLEQAGFWSAEKTLSFQFSEDGNIVRVLEAVSGFVMFGQPGAKFTVDAAILSRAGRDLLSASDIKFDYQAMADTALTHGATRFISGRAKKIGDMVSVSHDVDYIKSTRSDS